MIRSLVFFFLSATLLMNGQNRQQPKTIHVFVALCDNIHQGIVPVPKNLGNGQDAKNNLYWGALYGVKTYFKRSKDWTFEKKIAVDNPQILERVLFKHNSTNTYLLADAYDGKYIKQTTIDFLSSTSGCKAIEMTYKNQKINFGGGANLFAYIGHDGLMDFDIKQTFSSQNDLKREAILLACASKNYFSPYLKQTGAQPLLWSTGLMSPEAYTLKAAIDGWILKESNTEIHEKASQAYHKYQKCGIRGARRLLATGF